MRQLKKLRFLGVLAVSMMLVMLSGSSAIAHGEGSGSGSSGSGSSKPATTTTTKTETEHSGTTTETETENETETEHSTERQDVKDAAKSLLEQHKSDAQASVEDLRKNKPAQTEAVREKTCDARKTEIQNRATKYAASAAKHLATFDSIFAKVQAFHDTKKLDAANYDALVAAAKTKQTAAASAVVALQDTSKLTIDCTADPAVAVSQIKEAVKKAHDALHDYRLAVKDVIKALKAASDTTTSTTQSTESEQQ
jgi:hypothetical protein